MVTFGEQYAPIVVTPDDVVAQVMSQVWTLYYASNAEPPEFFQTVQLAGSQETVTPATLRAAIVEAGEKFGVSDLADQLVELLDYEAECAGPGFVYEEAML